MIGFGTLLNTIGVILGGGLGVLVKKGIDKKYQDALMKACGISVIVIGLSGTLSRMFVINENGIDTRGSMLLVMSLVIGAFVGELIDIEAKMDILGEKIKNKVGAQNDTGFVDGFVNTSLVICVGAMAIVGSIQDGITGDYSTLLIKAILDAVITAVFASTYGIGAVFSALMIFLYQGSITLVAHFAGSFIPDSVVSDLSFVGSTLIMCVGLNLTFNDKKVVKVGNMLPGLLVPVIYAVIMQFMK